MSSMPWVCERCGNTNEQHERDWAMRQDERDAERQQGAKDEREAIVTLLSQQVAVLRKISLNTAADSFECVQRLIEGRGKPPIIERGGQIGPAFGPLGEWVQCTTVNRDCLGGCRTRAEHERYNARRKP